MIPVLDIKDGKAVSGKLGKSDEYEELRSVLCNSSDPFVVAKTYEQLGFDEVYIADLDGILDSSPNLEVINRIVRGTNLSIMLDLGIWSTDQVILMEKVRPVVASETFCSLNLLEFPNDVVLCMDTRGGELISGTCGRLHDFVDIIKDSTRIEDIILLDLDRLGLEDGPNIGLCGDIAARMPGKKVIYGGGIRGLADIYSLKAAGADRVLVGAALHSGSIFKDG